MYAGIIRFFRFMSPLNSFLFVFVVYIFHNLLYYILSWTVTENFVKKDQFHIYIYLSLWGHGT